MDIKNLKKGDTVRISQDLTETNRVWTTTPEMRKMKGGSFKVAFADSPDCVHVNDNNGNSWTFSAKDIVDPQTIPSHEISTDLLMKKDSVYFDLKNL